MSSWIRICWAQVDATGILVCAGRLTWIKTATGWRSKCAKCSAAGIAAVGERVVLDAQLGEMSDGQRIETK